MKLCLKCIDEDMLICDWCKEAPDESEYDKDGNFYCEQVKDFVSWIDPACDKFECFMREKDEPEQGGLF